MQNAPGAGVAQATRLEQQGAYSVSVMCFDGARVLSFLLNYIFIWAFYSLKKLTDTCVHMQV